MDNDQLPPSTSTMLGCLDPVKHAKLIHDMDKYALLAGLGGANKRFIYESTEKYHLSETEIFVLENILKLPAAGKVGLMYFGGSPSAHQERLMALTGCLVRNHVDARLMTLEQALDGYAQERALVGRVTCIPNFHTLVTALPAWRVSILADLLSYLMQEGKLLIGFVEDEMKMRSAYHPSTHDLIRSRFVTIGDKKWH